MKALVLKSTNVPKEKKTSLYMLVKMETSHT